MSHTKEDGITHFADDATLEHIRKLEQQRDKLLEAAKDYILDAVECSEPNGGSKTYLESVIAECEVK